MDLALRRAWATLQSEKVTPPRGPSGLVPAGRWGWSDARGGMGCPNMCGDFV